MKSSLTPRDDPRPTGGSVGSADTATLVAPEAGPPRLFLPVVVAAIFISTLTGSMVNVVIPVIRAEFGASAAQIGWVVTGYALAYAIGVPLCGRVSDLFGVRRVFAVGLVGFAAGGLFCALAPTFPLLIGGRIVQGLGGAAIPALASVAVAKVLPAGSRGAALGLTASSVGVGSSVGPVVGGVVGELLGWRSLFVGSLVLTLILIPFAQRVLPDGRSEGARRFDLLGGGLLGLAAGLFLFGITQGQIAGFADPSSWGSFLAAAAAASGFARRLRTAPEPFVSPELFQNRQYLAAMQVGFFVMLAILSLLVFAPMLLLEVNGLSPAAAGLVLTPGSVALALLSPLAGRLSDRLGPRLPVVAGLLVLALSIFGLSTFAGAPAPIVALAMLGMGVASAFVQSPTSNAAANSLPREQVGGGMGIFVGAFFLGAGSGPALVGAFLAARQQGGGEALNPLYGLHAAAFSDAFLAILLALAVALAGALRLSGKVERPGEPVGDAPAAATTRPTRRRGLVGRAP